jgi:hypothetical protein
VAKNFKGTCCKNAFFQVDGEMKLNENWKWKEAKKIGLFDWVWKEKTFKQTHKKEIIAQYRDNEKCRRLFFGPDSLLHLDNWGLKHRSKVHDLWSQISSKTTFLSWFSPNRHKWSRWTNLFFHWLRKMLMKVVSVKQ